MSTPDAAEIPQLPRLRVALVHDWLTGMRGGERTLDALCQLFPAARLYTLVHVPGQVSEAIERLRPRTSFVQRLPLAKRFYRQYLPLFPAAVETFDLDEADLVISTSHCAVKSVIAPGRAKHLCYCFTPMRYAWDQFDAYFGPRRLGALSRPARSVLSAIARWDASTSGRPDRYVAISQYVARRIGRYYNRESAVIYPPVETEFYHPDGGTPDGYCLVVSALVPYKRLDIAIEACRRASMPLKVVGDGPEQASLTRLARDSGANIELLGRRSDEEVRALYRRALAVLLPGEEDFGIVPVEAQACGRPVVAFGRGGAVETIIDGETGVLVPECTPDAFADGIERIRQLQVDALAIRRHAVRFSRERFIREMTTTVADLLSTKPALESALS